jgi:hypothetical protein
MKVMLQKIFLGAFAVLLITLAVLKHYEQKAVEDEVNGRILLAISIIKKSLRSPSSFILVSGKEVWSGKNTEGDAAHIVRIEYDAQNGFGADIRDCKLVAYNDKGKKYEWKENGAMNQCGTKLFDETQMVEIIRKINFEK